MSGDSEVTSIEKDWSTNPRWKGIKRGYGAQEVMRLRGSVQVEHTLARRGADRLWKLLQQEPFVNALGALTGNQAMQQVRAGLKARSLITHAGLFTALAASLAKSKERPYDFAVVDESQDISIAQLRFLAVLGGGRVFRRLLRFRRADGLARDGF